MAIFINKKKKILISENVHPLGQGFSLAKVSNLKGCPTYKNIFWIFKM
jgi:hypothetical protein